MEAIYFFIQIRMASTRFPGKVLQPIDEHRTLMECVHERIQHSKFYSPERTYFLTSDNKSDDPLVEIFRSKNWNYLRGDEHRVFTRFVDACEKLEPSYFFRICSDNPFLEPKFMDELGDSVQAHPEYDYVSFSDSHGTPVIKTHYGFFAELIKAKTFMEIDREELSSEQLEHVTPIFYEQPHRFKIKLKPMPTSFVHEDIRLTIDTKEDLDVARKIFANMPRNFNIYDVYDYVKKERELMERMRTQIERHAK